MARDFSKAFYNSKEWKVTREFVLMRDHFLCVHCGAPAVEVHHIIKLTPNNIGDISITMNPENLVSLCKDCHFKEHKNDKANGHRKNDGSAYDSEQYVFDDLGQIVPRTTLPG